MNLNASKARVPQLGAVPTTLKLKFNKIPEPESGSEFEKPEILIVSESIWVKPTLHPSDIVPVVECVIGVVTIDES